MLRKDYYVLTAKMKDIWHKNATDLNDADHVEKWVTDGTPILILDVINAMR